MPSKASTKAGTAAAASPQKKDTKQSTDVSSALSRLLVRPPIEDVFVRYNTGNFFPSVQYFRCECREPQLFFSALEFTGLHNGWVQGPTTSKERWIFEIASNFKRTHSFAA
jgi:hypothetical protein